MMVVGGVLMIGKKRFMRRSLDVQLFIHFPSHADLACKFKHKGILVLIMKCDIDNPC